MSTTHWRGRSRSKDVLVDDVIFASSLVTVGRFRATVGHPSFRDSGPIERAIFVFPRTCVTIQHEGGCSFTTDTCTVVFYNEGQRYTREPVSPRGDHCEWFSVRPDVLLEVLSSTDPTALDRQDRPFRHAYGPSDARTYALQRLVITHVQRESCPDALAVEEAVLKALERVAQLAQGRPVPTSEDNAALPANPADAAGVAHCARTFLARHFTESFLLDEIAERVNCSVFHLCRVFRRETGTTIHRYRHQLRLRHALELVADSSGCLTDVALSLGFSSHSHFTAAFRQTFDTTPSAFREAASSRRVREMSAQLLPDSGVSPV